MNGHAESKAELEKLVEALLDFSSQEILPDKELADLLILNQILEEEPYKAKVLREEIRNPAYGLEAEDLENFAVRKMALQMDRYIQQVMKEIEQAHKSKGVESIVSGDDLRDALTAQINTLSDEKKKKIHPILMRICDLQFATPGLSGGKLSYQFSTFALEIANALPDDIKMLENESLKLKETKKEEMPLKKKNRLSHFYQDVTKNQQLEKKGRMAQLMDTLFSLLSIQDVSFLQWKQLLDISIERGKNRKKAEDNAKALGVMGVDFLKSIQIMENIYFNAIDLVNHVFQRQEEDKKILFQQELATLISSAWSSVQLERIRDLLIQFKDAVFLGKTIKGKSVQFYFDPLISAMDICINERRNKTPPQQEQAVSSDVSLAAAIQSVTERMGAKAKIKKAIIQLIHHQKKIMAALNSQNTNKVILSLIQLGDYLRLAFPGENIKQIQTKLPDFPEFKAQEIPNPEGLGAALEACENVPFFKAATLGSQCFSLLMGEERCHAIRSQNSGSSSSARDIFYFWQETKERQAIQSTLQSEKKEFSELRNKLIVKYAPSKPERASEKQQTLSQAKKLEMDQQAAAEEYYANPTPDHYAAIECVSRKAKLEVYIQYLGDRIRSIESSKKLDNDEKKHEYQISHPGYKILKEKHAVAVTLNTIFIHGAGEPRRTRPFEKLQDYKEAHKAALPLLSRHCTWAETKFLTLRPSWLRSVVLWVKTARMPSLPAISFFGNKKKTDVKSEAVKSESKVSRREP